MNNKKAFHLLETWARPYLYTNGQTMKLIFDDKLPIGTGKADEENQKITIGIKPYKKNFISEYSQIKDSDFIKMGITTFHEITHHEQKTIENLSQELTLSELSKYMNPGYYQHNWQVLPHEIDAEYGGIMKMWSKLEQEFPDKADKLMLDHLTDRARNTVYMIHMPEEGFTSKTQINSLFEQAYNNASRTLPLGFLRSDDEVARMCTTDNKILRLEYAAIYNKLATPASGKEMDKMMASIVSYIHPELQETYSTIDFDGLNPSHIFKIPIPETTDEIRKRLGLNSSFAEAVGRLSSDDSQLTL